MPDDSQMVRPMRVDLTRLGFRERRTPDDVNQTLTSAPVEAFEKYIDARA